VSGHRALALLLLAVLGVVPAGSQQRAAELTVRYRSAETVYLDAGSAAGIAVGDRLEVRRDGAAIAEIEVVFVAERSASARVLTERQPVRVGDSARRIGAAPPAAPASPPSTAPAPAPASPPDSPRATATRPGRRGGRARATRVSGTVSMEWRSVAGQGDEVPARDSTRSLARIQVRARDIAGTPLQLRLRGRLFDLSRQGQLDGRPANEERNRLYEAMVVYDEPEARFAVRAGRLGSAPFLGLGYLDGALVEVRPLRRLAAGAVYGKRAEGAEIGSDAAGGTKAGAFVRFGSAPAGEPAGRAFEVTVAGFREAADDPRFGRDYVSLESRVAGGERWSFYQFAELDLDVPAAAGGESGQQLSIASLTLLRRGERGGRLALSYDRFQRYPVEEDLGAPEGFLDRLVRQGLHASWSRESGGGLGLSVDVGARFREDAPPIHPVLGPFGGAETTYSAGLGVRHSRLPGGLFAGLSVTGFQSASVEGGLASLRAGKRFAGGHELDLTLGGSVHRAALDERALGWGRVGVWIELPADLFARGEIEVLAGDDVGRQRLTVGLGYRL
jgi:hypothetical protein